MEQIAPEHVNCVIVCSEKQQDQVFGKVWIAHGSGEGRDHKSVPSDTRKVDQLLPNRIATTQH